MTARKQSTTSTALPVNAQKRLVAERMIQVIARELASGKQIPGVSREFALQTAGELCNYFPGVRQGLTKWDARLGSVSGAGAVKPAAKPAKSRKPASAAKPAARTTRKPAARTTKPAASPASMPATKPATATASA